jgi:hypothetical protein
MPLYYFIAAPMLLLASVGVFAQAQPKIDIETMSAAVVLLESPSVATQSIDGKSYEVVLRDPDTGRLQDKMETSVGTGVLVVDVSGQMFLVTAAHVAADTNAATRFVFRVQGDRPKSLKLENLLAAPIATAWSIHARSDVAAARLNIPPELAHLFNEHFLALSMFDQELSAPRRTHDLITLGFPLGLGAEGHFSPISRESKAASGLLSLPRFDTHTVQDFFLLDGPSVGGFSGAPVLTLPGSCRESCFDVRPPKTSERLRCVGIVHGTVSDKTGGKMAAVTPGAVARELLMSMGAVADQ